MSNALSYDPVPAIAEIDACGDTAELFADIGATLGVPVVNLVWRHLATIPGALPWAWTSLKPLYESTAIASEAETLSAAIDLPPYIAEHTALSMPTLTAAGLSGPDLDRITMILRSYERSNAMNIIAVDTLRSCLESGDKVYGNLVAELLGLYCDGTALSKIDETVWRTIGGANQQDRFAELAEVVAWDRTRVTMSALLNNGKSHVAPLSCEPSGASGHGIAK